MSHGVILVIDDNPTTRTMLRLALQAEGYGVMEAETGAAALEAMQHHDVDLVLQDWVLPDIGGLELARSLRALPGGTERPIIAVSGFHRMLEETGGAHRLPLNEGVEGVAQHFLRLLSHRLEIAPDALLRRSVLLFRALGDVDGFVSDPFEIGHQPERTGEEAKVVGHRLPEGEDPQDQRVDVHLVAVNVPVELLDLGGELRGPLPERLERELQPPLAPGAHRQRVCSKLA